MKQTLKSLSKSSVFDSVLNSSRSLCSGLSLFSKELDETLKKENLNHNNREQRINDLWNNLTIEEKVLYQIKEQFISDFTINKYNGKMLKLKQALYNIEHIKVIPRPTEFTIFCGQRLSQLKQTSSLQEYRQKLKIVADEFKRLNKAELKKLEIIMEAQMQVYQTQSARLLSTVKEMELREARYTNNIA